MTEMIFLTMRSRSRHVRLRACEVHKVLPLVWKSRDGNRSLRLSLSLASPLLLSSFPGLFPTDVLAPPLLPLVLQQFRNQMQRVTTEKIFSRMEHC